MGGLVSLSLSRLDRRARPGGLVLEGLSIYPIVTVTSSSGWRITSLYQIQKILGLARLVTPLVPPWGPDGLANASAWALRDLGADVFITHGRISFATIKRAARPSIAPGISTSHGLITH